MLRSMAKWETVTQSVSKVCWKCRIGAGVKEVFKDGKFPIVLSGDHSNAAGTIAGIRMAYPDSTLGVIWIDAHADLHTPFTTPSGNMHGMPLAVSLAEDDIQIK